MRSRVEIYPWLPDTRTHCTNSAAPVALLSVAFMGTFTFVMGGCVGLDRRAFAAQSTRCVHVIWHSIAESGYTHAPAAVSSAHAHFCTCGGLLRRFIVCRKGEGIATRRFLEGLTLGLELFRKCKTKHSKYKLWAIDTIVCNAPSSCLHTANHSHKLERLCFGRPLQYRY